MDIKELINKLAEDMQAFNSLYKNKLHSKTKNDDFSKVEEKLGFSIHNDLKEYLNSFYFSKLQGVILPNQIKPTDTWGNWFEFKEQNKKIQVTLNGIKDENINLESFIESSFNDWTGGYDFGRRFRIGSLYDSR